MPNPAESSAPAPAGPGSSNSAKLFGLIHRLSPTLDADDLALLNAIYVELKAAEPAPAPAEPKPAKDA